MRRALSLKVEWAWSQGQLRTHDELELFAEKIYRETAFRYCMSQFHLERNRQLGVCELSKDIRIILRVLSYGGRKASDIPSQRVAYLRSQLGF